MPKDNNDDVQKVAFVKKIFLIRKVIRMVKSLFLSNFNQLYWEWYAFVENEDEIAAMMAAAELEEDWEDE